VFGEELGFWKYVFICPSTVLEMWKKRKRNAIAHFLKVPQSFRTIFQPEME